MSREGGSERRLSEIRTGSSNQVARYLQQFMQ